MSRAWVTAAFEVGLWYPTCGCTQGVWNPALTWPRAAPKLRGRRHGHRDLRPSRPAGHAARRVLREPPAPPRAIRRGRLLLLSPCRAPRDPSGARPLPRHLHLGGDPAHPTHPPRPPRLLPGPLTTP